MTFLVFLVSFPLTKNYLALQVGGDAVGQLLTHHKKFKNAIKPKMSKQKFNSVKKLYVMDKSGYDFRIQRAKIDKEDMKYFKQ
jgi:hypothetical protein